MGKLTVNLEHPYFFYFSSWRHDEISKKFKTVAPNHSSKLPSRSSYVDSYEK